MGEQGEHREHEKMVNINPMTLNTLFMIQNTLIVTQNTLFGNQMTQTVYLRLLCRWLKKS